MFPDFEMIQMKKWLHHLSNDPTLNLTTSAFKSVLTDTKFALLQKTIELLNAERAALALILPALTPEATRYWTAAQKALTAAEDAKKKKSRKSRDIMFGKASDAYDMWESLSKEDRAHFSTVDLKNPPKAFDNIEHIKWMMPRLRSAADERSDLRHIEHDAQYAILYCVVRERDPTVCKELKAPSNKVIKTMQSLDPG